DGRVEDLTIARNQRAAAVEIRVLVDEVVEDPARRTNRGLAVAEHVPRHADARAPRDGWLVLVPPVLHAAARVGRMMAQAVEPHAIRNRARAGNRLARIRLRQEDAREERVDGFAVGRGASLVAGHAG